MTLPIGFGDSNNSKQLEKELLEIVSDLQKVTEKLVKTSWKIKDAKAENAFIRGHLALVSGYLQGYADMVNNIGGNICDLFDFYQ